MYIIVCICDIILEQVNYTYIDLACFFLSSFSSLI